MAPILPPAEGVSNPPTAYTIDDMPMGGCRNWRIHDEHLAAGYLKCENQR